MKQIACDNECPTDVAEGMTEVVYGGPTMGASPKATARLREREVDLEREVSETKFFVKRVTRQRVRRRIRSLNKLVATASLATFGCGGGCGHPGPSPDDDTANDGGDAGWVDGGGGPVINVRTLPDGGGVPDGSVVVGGRPVLYDIELTTSVEAWPGVIATHRSVVAKDGTVSSTCEAGTAHGTATYPPPAWSGGDAFCIAHGSLPWDTHLDGGMFYFWSDLHRRDGGLVIYDNNGSVDDGTGARLK